MSNSPELLSNGGSFLMFLLTCAIKSKEINCFDNII